MLLCVGGGGSSGSATLDRLMDQIPFGPKPKIVDLTSDRKLADKVVHHPCAFKTLAAPVLDVLPCHRSSSPA